VITCGWGRLSKAFCALALSAVAVSAGAEVAGDVTFVTCSQAGGSFRISELNRTVSYFSDRYQEYRPICRDCEITEWGNNITLRDDGRTIARIDRVSGTIWVRGTEAKPVAGSTSVRSFEGKCVRGKAAVPKKKSLESARAF
jgi:hypothetical protein